MHTISQLINDKALFVINHSGGKDSQAMMIKMLEIIPASQMLVVHASLGDVEWKGALELAEKQARDAGVEFIVARAEKSFLDMVEKRFADRPGVPSWPSAKYRQCTSDLKRNPIERDIRRYMKARGLTLVVSCTGIRAAESNSRSKLAPFKLSEKNSKAGRSWYEWCPIFTLSTAEVFATIKAAGQQPHEAYALGNERLSCVFCIMGSKGDLALGAKHNPELFARYVELEERTGYTMHMSQRSLTDLVNDAQQFAA
jgi:3'-phosphoadenosine 5'-phosphosulfate sulfotransferase (PAPS reductase)/FAD synthetase